MEAMEELRRSKLVPKCAVGLPILLVDHDTASLMCLASMLEQYSYKVTTTELTSVAISMIVERNETFKLVMADVNMDNNNSLSFLDMVVKKDIPVILMSSERNEDTAEKAIAHGACLHLQKPISLNDLKYLWQHVYRNENEYSMNKTLSFGNESGAININETTSDSESTAGGNSSYDDERENRNDKRSQLSNSESSDSGKMEAIDEEGREENKNNQSGSNRGRKSRLVWNQKLHHKFTAAINELGHKNARPKLILNMMNEPNLTHRQVASHLQKYKVRVKRFSTATSGNLSSVMNASRSIHGKPGLFYIPQKNKPVLSPLGHESSNFSIGAADTNGFPNLHQDSNNATMISSLYQNQHFPSVPQDIHQKLHVTDLDSTDSISSLNQAQEFPSMFPCVPESTSVEYPAMPNADQSPAIIMEAATFSENQEQHSPEFVDLSKALNEESDECRGSAGFEPHPGEVDQYCEWLKEAMFGNNEQS